LSTSNKDYDDDDDDDDEIMILVGKQAGNVRTITLNIYDTTQQQVRCA